MVPPQLKTVTWSQPDDPLEARRLLQIDSSKRVEHLTIAPARPRSRTDKTPSLRPSRTPRGAPTERTKRLRFDRHEHFEMPRQNGKTAFASTVANTSRCPDRTNKPPSFRPSRTHRHPSKERTKRLRFNCREHFQVPRPNEQNPVNVPKKRHSFDPSLPQNRPTSTRSLPQNGQTLTRTLPRNRARLLDSLP